MTQMGKEYCRDAAEYWGLGFVWREFRDATNDIMSGIASWNENDDGCYSQKDRKEMDERMKKGIARLEMCLQYYQKVAGDRKERMEINSYQRQFIASALEGMGKPIQARWIINGK